MPSAVGAILVERIGDDAYRAWCPLFADCEAVATTPEAARQAVEFAVERILRERDAALPPAAREELL